MSARDLRLILGYAVLFGSVVVGLGYQHRFAVELPPSGSASLAPSVSTIQPQPGDRIAGRHASPLRSIE
jgi:hypothetical protein